MDRENPVLFLFNYFSYYSFRDLFDSGCFVIESFSRREIICIAPGERSEPGESGTPPKSLSSPEGANELALDIRETPKQLAPFRDRAFVTFPLFPGFLSVTRGYAHPALFEGCLAIGAAFEALVPAPSMGGGDTRISPPLEVVDAPLA